MVLPQAGVVINSQASNFLMIVRGSAASL